MNATFPIQTRWISARKRVGLGGLFLAVLFGFSAGCQRDSSTAAREALPAQKPSSSRFSVETRAIKEIVGIPTGTLDEHGQPVMVPCATCHTTKPANLLAKVGTPLTQFHQGLKGQHGSLSCTSCHNASDGYTTLRLADGTAVPSRDVMRLCAQCHGTQFRDYQHGAHGGMSGFWNLEQGGRVRNQCTNCHDTHTPKYPTVVPAPGPNDRFQTGEHHE